CEWSARAELRRHVLGEGGMTGRFRLFVALCVWVIAGLGSALAQISWQSGVDQNVNPATRQALERMQQI
ncbi:hypothetical protein, partial [Stenotrophomonas maltophilia]|uniref:hypothetical protein n=1 Tax=Stenotrophomonas maltophilia TaxID=40324 RepID=UPI001954957C